MQKKLKPVYTLYKFDRERRPSRKNAEARATIARRFKLLCADAGMKVPEVAQALHVTERTVYAWFSGQTAVPFAAYKLLRILSRFELPGAAWVGWSMHSGKLWTPEGFGFEPQDGSWWGLTVRQARCFRACYAELGAARRAVPHPETQAIPDGNHGDNTRCTEFAP